MTILFLSSGISFGLYFLLAEFLKIPYLRTSKAIINMGREKKNLSSAIDSLLMDVATRLSKIMPMDEYKRNRMDATLKAAGIKMTPECYAAYAFVKAGAVLIGIVPCLFFLPFLSIIIILLSILVYFKEIRKADEKLRTKRESIEAELPRFVSTIEQYLKSSRDVLSILENYKRNACQTMVQELNITCADMRSGGYESALMRFEARINSPPLSDVARGLIAVIRGDNGLLYFQMLAHDFKQMELRKLKAQAQKIPSKIRIFSFIMLLCFMITYLAVIAVQIITSLNVMF